MGFKHKVCGLAPKSTSVFLKDSVDPNAGVHERPGQVLVSGVGYVDPSLKASNPKDALGSDKIPFHLWPETASVMGSLGMLEGDLKYGRANWREAGVKASIYVDALRRHVDAWFECEDNAEDSGLHHFCHMLACCGILADAWANGTLVDDRQYTPKKGVWRAFIEKMTPHVPRLKGLHAGKNPKRWTAADNTLTSQTCDCGYENISANAPTSGGRHADSCPDNEPTLLEPQWPDGTIGALREKI